MTIDKHLQNIIYLINQLNMDNVTLNIIKDTLGKIELEINMVKNKIVEKEKEEENILSLREAILGGKVSLRR